MEGNHCRLFDENLVRNIMISTGILLWEHIKGNPGTSQSDICDFIELNADTIIWNTIEDMNSSGDFAVDDGEEEDDGGEPPGSGEEGEEYLPGQV